MFVYRILKPNRPKWALRQKPKSSTARLPGERDTDSVLLQDVTFKVSTRAAAWCTQANRRLVHAFAEGRVCDDVMAVICSKPRVRISYHHARGAFYRCDTGAPVRCCEYVLFSADGNAYAAGVIE